jgi:hypothetical protein
MLSRAFCFVLTRIKNEECDIIDKTITGGIKMTIVRHGTMQVVKAFQFKLGTVESTTPVTLIDLGFTEDEVKQADHAMISVEDANVRYRLDGLASPSPTLGHPILSHDDISIYGFANLLLLEIIATSGTAKLTITLAKRA